MTDTVEGELAGLPVVTLEGELAASREAAFAEALSEGHDIQDASRVAAYADRVSGDCASGRERVQSAVKANVVRKIKTEGLGLAYGELKKLLKNGTTPAVKLGAIKVMLALNGLGAGKDGDEPDDIGTMTEAQLERFIQRAQKIVERGGDPPVLRVAP